MNKSFIKNISSVILLLSLNSVGTISPDSFILNVNGVKISNTQYVKLKNMGFEEREIQHLSLDKYLTLKEINPIRYVSSFVDIMNYSSVKFKNIYDDTYQNIDNKTLKTTATWYKNGTSNDYVFIKVNFSCDKTFYRKKDYIGVRCDSNLQPKRSYINGRSLPTFSSEFSYIRNYYYLYEDDFGFNNTEERKQYYENQTISNLEDSKYIYFIENGILAYYDNIPLDDRKEHFGGDEYLHNHYIIENTYRDFLITFEANFIFKQMSIQNCELQGVFGEQANGTIVPNVSFSFQTTPPYVSINLDGNNKDGDFKKMSNNIFLEDR